MTDLASGAAAVVVAPPTPGAGHGSWRGFVRDVGLVARFELGEAARSRLLVVMVLLFVGAGALGAWGYSEMLGRIEENAARVTGAPTSRRPGGTLRQMRQSTSYRQMLRAFFRDDDKADHFAAVPPIVLFFAWASFACTPWLILFTSAETIAAEVSSRSIRYSIVRTSRLRFALGKAAGQAAIVAGVTGLSAAVYYGVAWSQLAGFEHGPTAAAMASYLPRVLLYNLPFLAWAMFASMATASANLARTVSFGGAIAMSVFDGLAASARLRTGPVSESLWDLARYLTPFAHKDGLWYPPGGALASDVAVCLSLTVLYFSAGFAILRRRDL